MAEIAMREDQLTGLVQQMHDKLALAEKQQGAEREATVAEIRGHHSDATNAVDLYRMEFRSLTHQERGVYKEKLRGHRSALKKIAQELQWMAQNADARGELLAGANPNRGTAMDNPDLDNPEALMNHGRDLQDASIKSLQRTVGTVAATKEVAADTAVKVHAQTEQLQSLYDDLYEIDDMLDRSVAIVKRMARRVASQRVLWILMFMIVVGIVAIVVLRVNGSDGSSSSGDQDPSSSSGNKVVYDPESGEDFVAPLSRATQQALTYYRRRRVSQL